MLVASLPRIAANVVSILSSDVMSRATTFVLYALVARHLGAHEFGQMSLALTLFYTFQVLAAAGLKTLVTREVAKDRAETGRYVVNGSLVAVAASGLAIVALLVFVSLMDYAPDTTSVILLLALGLLPFALSAVCEAVFQAWERMHYIAYANAPVNLAKMGLGFAVLQQGYGLNQVIAVMMLSQVVLVVIEWWVIAHRIERPILALDLPFAVHVARSTMTFLGIDALIAIAASLNVVLLSKLSDEVEVGLYSAAFQLLSPVMLVLQSVVLSVFPMMCRHVDPGFEALRRIAEQVMALLLALVLPLAVGLFFLAEPILLLLYAKRDFMQSTQLLQVAVWGLIPTALMSVLGYVLMATHRERLTLGLVAAHALGNLLIGLVVIGKFGALGAVAMVLLDKVLGLVEHYAIVSRLLPKVALSTRVWRPIVASACLAACLALVRDYGLIVSTISGGLVYAGVLLALTIWSFGGPAQLRAAYLRQWSE
ncbi:MAG: oligosaccharide flippase family protein [Chloroflexota bacterium]|nr:oligosaccharide flippase family protein [Chloroflexota bacterium]